MHEKTFDIYHNDLSIVPDGYVQIDELIAPSIQILNRKGYITIGCCSGHSFKDHVTKLSSEVEYEVIYGQGSGYNSHIMFKEGISLPNLPPGFKMKSKPILPPDFCINNPLEPGEYYTREFIIESSIGSVLIIEKGVYKRPGEDFFETSWNILETMEQLYKWALNLPDFKDE
jgi:hypothetical protein